jgi:dCTP deaminase
MILRISRKYARIRKRKDILDLYVENMSDGWFINNKYFITEEGKEYLIQPNEHLLIESLEYLEVPTYLTALIGLRSTFSRLGLFPIKLYEGMAIFKVIFMNLSSDTEVYHGKYQGQSGIMLPKKDLR